MRRPRRRTHHPLVRLAGAAARLPRYLNLARGLAGDPAVPVWRKAALAGGIAYAISPVDLVPGIIPVVGQLDDLAALLLALRVALAGCPPPAAAAHLTEVGLSDTALNADLVTVRAVGGWLAGGALSLAWRGATLPLRLLARAVRLGRPRPAA